MAELDCTDLLNRLTKLDAFVVDLSGRKGTAVFYSQGFDGETNFKMAEECKRNNPDAYTIEQTPAGKFFEGNIKACYKEGLISKAEFRELGDTTSQMFAADAEGPAIGFVKNSSERGTFARKEVTVFGKGNSKITSFNGVDIDLVKQTGSDTSAQMQNTLQMLGDHSSLDNCRPPKGGAGATISASAIPKVPATHTRTVNYGMVAAGAALAIGSAIAFQPEGEAVAVPMIAAGFGNAALEAAKNKSLGDQSFNNIQNSPALADSIAQLKNAGAMLKDSPALNAPYAIADSARLQKQINLA